MNTSFALSAFQWRGVWGERTPSTPGRGYCANLGHPEDETGLVYMRARYYEPTTGRFISEDPARDGVNWYLYADGDPVGKVDASGCTNVVDIIFLIYQLGFPFFLAGYALIYKQEILLKAKIEGANELAKAFAQRVEAGIGLEAFQGITDDLLKTFRYVRDMQAQALKLSQTRGRIADMAIYYFAGEAAILALEVAFGEWL
jgi:RHS repeat-associated protein